MRDFGSALFQRTHAATAAVKAAVLSMWFSMCSPGICEHYCSAYSLGAGTIMLLGRILPMPTIGRGQKGQAKH